MFHTHLTLPSGRHLLLLYFFVSRKACPILGETLDVILNDCAPDAVLVLVETCIVHPAPVDLVRLLPYAGLRSRDCLVLLLDSARHASFAVEGLGGLLYICLITISAGRRPCMKSSI